MSKPYDGSGFVGVDPWLTRSPEMPSVEDPPEPDDADAEVASVDPWLTDADDGRRLRLHPDDPREPEPEPALYFCGHCGADAFSPVTVAGIGVFCSTRCASAYQMPSAKRSA